MLTEATTLLTYTAVLGLALITCHSLVQLNKMAAVIAVLVPGLALITCRGLVQLNKMAVVIAVLVLGLGTSITCMNGLTHGEVATYNGYGVGSGASDLGWGPWKVPDPLRSRRLLPAGAFLRQRGEWCLETYRKAPGRTSRLLAASQPSPRTLQPWRSSWEGKAAPRQGGGCATEGRAARARRLGQGRRFWQGCSPTPTAAWLRWEKPAPRPPRWRASRPMRRCRMNEALLDRVLEAAANYGLPCSCPDAARGGWRGWRTTGKARPGPARACPRPCKEGACPRAAVGGDPGCRPFVLGWRRLCTVGECHSHCNSTIFLQKIFSCP